MSLSAIFFTFSRAVNGTPEGGMTSRDVGEIELLENGR